MKLWAYFGPTQDNFGEKKKELQFPFNNRFFNPLGADPQYVFTLATEVGPYMPAIIPEAQLFSLRIFNKMYERVYKRIMTDWNLKDEDELGFLILKLANLTV